jgi:hypothetical protein
VGAAIAQHNLTSATSGAFAALFGYLGDLLPWTPARYTLLLGLVTVQLVTSHSKSLTINPVDALQSASFAILAFLIDLWWDLNAVISVFWAVQIYSAHLISWACAAVLLDGPLEDTGLDLIDSGIRMMWHFIVAALLFHGRTIYHYVVAHVWTWATLSLILLWNGFILEFASEQSTRWWFFTGDNWEMAYESLVAVRETWKPAWALYSEYSPKFRHFLWLSWRQYLERRAVAALGFYQRPTFDYSTVPVKEGEIRLLYMPRRSWNPFADGLLRVALYAVPLEGRGDGEAISARDAEYEALSYTWGSQVTRRPILINGMRFDIGENLYELLHARRSLFTSRFIWADALCINQADDEEKTEQVLHMSKIYMRANRVVAWLGASFYAHLAARTLLELSYKWQTERARPDWFVSCWDHQSTAWSAFVKMILANPYFSRAWILQEAALGFDLQFYIGGLYIRPDTMWHALTAITQPEVLSAICVDSGLLGNNDLDGIKNWYHAFFLRPSDPKARHDENAAHPLGLVLSWSSRLLATNPLDKVYAVLGVSNSAVAKSIEPKYKGTSTTELFHSTAMELLTSEEDAEFVFPHAGIRDPDTKPGLPTWAPDWEHEATKQGELLSIHPIPGMRKLEKLLDIGVKADVYSILASSKYAAGGADSKPSFRVVDASGTKLSTAAVLVDSVQHRTKAYNHLSISVTYHMAWLFEAESISHQIGDEVALARTLIADRSNDNDNMADLRGGNPETLLRAYRSFRRHFPVAELDALPFARLRGVLDPRAQAAADARAEAVMAGLGYAGRFKTACGGRRLAVTAGRRFALVPPTAEVGDVFAVIPGMQTPYVLRLCRGSAGAEPEYQLVGECYLDGAMGGELMDIGSVVEVVLV